MLIHVRAQPDVDPLCIIQINWNFFTSVDGTEKGVNEHTAQRENVVSLWEHAHASFKIKLPLFSFESLLCGAFYNQLILHWMAQ